MKKQNTIFIQIASYRDPELIPTLKHCFERAKYPENLRFGICWQYGEEENIDEFKKYIEEISIYTKSCIKQASVKQSWTVENQI